MAVWIENLVTAKRARKFSKECMIATIGIQISLNYESIAWALLSVQIEVTY